MAMCNFTRYHKLIAVDFHSGNLTPGNMALGSGYFRQAKGNQSGRIVSLTFHELSVRTSSTEFTRKIRSRAIANVPDLIAQADH